MHARNSSLTEWTRCFVLLFIAPFAMDCTPKAGTKVPPPGHEAQAKPKPEIEKVDFYFASLDSIRPYVHRFPTGAIAAAAPALDQRDFYPPDSLLAKYRSTAKAKGERAEFIRKPEHPFKILGEVAASLVWQSSTEQPIEQPIKSLPMAPHGRPWIDLKKYDWPMAFQEIRAQAGAMGADAVLEIFCGKGISAIWSPTQYSAVPVYDASGQIVGGYGQVVPGGVGVAPWKLMGLAVKWEKDK